MKKIVLMIAFIATGLVASAQVGVGTTDPKVSLQVDKSVVATDADGVLVPRVTVAELNAKAATYGPNQNGALVFVTAIAGAIDETSNVTATGFHYYNNDTDKWVAVSGAQAAVPHQNIRGSVVTVTSATYTVLPSDHVIITNHTAGVTVTLPALSVAETGRLLYIVNDNTGAFANTITAQPTALPFGNGMNQFRGRCYVWTGTKWLALAQA